MYEDFRKYAVEDAQAGYRLVITWVVIVKWFYKVLKVTLSLIFFYHLDEK